MYRTECQLPACANSERWSSEVDSLSLAMYLTTAVNLQAPEVWWAPCFHSVSGNNRVLEMQSEAIHLQTPAGSWYLEESLSKLAFY